MTRVSHTPSPQLRKATGFRNVRRISIARRDGTPAAKFFGCASRQLDLEECSPGPSGAGVFSLHSSRARPRQLLRRARGAVPPATAARAGSIDGSGRTARFTRFGGRSLPRAGVLRTVSLTLRCCRHGPDLPRRTVLSCAHKRGLLELQREGGTKLARASVRVCTTGLPHRPSLLSRTTPRARWRRAREFEPVLLSLGLIRIAWPPPHCADPSPGWSARAGHDPRSPGDASGGNRPLAGPQVGAIRAEPQGPCEARA